MAEKRTLKEKLIARHWVNCEKEDLARLALQSPTPGIKTLCDIPYIDDGRKEHLLDVYYPQGTAKPLPVIVNIHGGGFTYGYKELNKYYDMFVASHGFTVFNLDYRVAPETRFPGQVRDISAAMRWVAANGHSFPCDMENVFITGDSAGGMHAMFSALLEHNPRLQALYGVKPSGLRIRSLGLISGGFVFTRGLGKVMAGPMFGKGYAKMETYRSLNLDTLECLEQLPPCYLVTSEEDFVTTHSRRFAQLLQEKGVEHELHVWPKGGERQLGHIFSLLYPTWEESRQTTREMVEFFRKRLKITA